MARMPTGLNPALNRERTSSRRATAARLALSISLAVLWSLTLGGPPYGASAALPPFAIDRAALATAPAVAGVQAIGIIPENCPEACLVLFNQADLEAIYDAQPAL